MITSASILLYGWDAGLLETRQWVLERAGHQVKVAAHLPEIDRLSAMDHFDLLILCHSLTAEECRHASALARLHRPAIKVLVLAADRSTCAAPALGEVLDAMAGPQKLVSTVAKLVGSTE